MIARWLRLGAPCFCLAALAACGSDTPPDDSTDTTDTALDGSGDTSTDTDGDTALDGSGGDTSTDTAETSVPPGCGDGVLDDGEACDDGNDIETDGCSSTCVVSVCGDGVVNTSRSVRTFASPVVRNLSGSEGHVCSEGATCPAGRCPVAENPTAPEHGICQALGFARAVEVLWGDGERVVGEPNPRAANWVCQDYVCTQGTTEDTGNCLRSQMLREIVCETVALEACDEGEANADAADACRTSCTRPACGDRIVDTGEACDDGNTVGGDGCASNCRAAVCGDGLIGDGEECDDGNNVETDGCTNACRAPRCGDGVVQNLVREDTLTGPVVTNPFGATGYVCDDGSLCFDGSCDVSTDGSAPEHGICQSLGYGRAVNVTWGGGPGATSEPMPHAYNWECVNFECTEGFDPTSIDDCSASEMLLSITCRGGSTEQCDKGDANSDAPDATCRTDCTAQRCGDGIVDTGEQCDDGNSSDLDDCTNDCRSVICGDGVVMGAEECDRGEDNSESPDAECRTDCALAGCTDGVIDSGEQCDDGNSDDSDTCTNDCIQRICGDGQVVTPEQCDLGEANSDLPNALCRTDCSPSRCGDAVVDFDEECDDGNLEDNDACTIICEDILCGDGVVRGDEACDEGEANSELPGSLCRTDCVPAGCGDGVTDPGEQCDDGNGVDNDGCSNVCRTPGCGDGIVQAGEACDDGNRTDSDGCSNLCRAARCGDGIANTAQQTFASPVVTNPFGESGRVCDDGSLCSADTCDVSADGEAPEHGICQALGFARALSVTWGGGAGDTDAVMPHAFNWTCTDFVCGPSDSPSTVDNCGPSEMLASITCIGAEECDAGTANSNLPGAACRPGCVLPSCGDRIVDPGEACDDGNDVNTDACDTSCRLNRCGDGIVSGVESCDQGIGNSNLPNALCRTNCTDARCGDGVVDFGEQCDDGNAVDTDACTRLCAPPACGDGAVQAGEECDDGNDIDNDQCSNGCRTARCGDGIPSVADVLLEGPVVTNPFGATGRVCDDGASCFIESCDLSADGSAPEHGICQALGFARAATVTWGDGPGDTDTEMPHAYNWICNDFVCVEGTNDFSGDNCSASEMLLNIRCIGAEECDLGAANSDAPGAGCRTDCTVGGCGDGIVDPGETCDDGNSDNGDGCTAACGAPRCGDGVTSPGEGCDDGNDRDDDGCLAGCVRAACGDGSVNGAPEESPLESPRVASPAGITSYVCGEGATCPGGSCDVSGIPTAPEHGICQSFGFDRAVRATWTGIDGALNLTAARADHWVCEGYACATAPDADLSNTCSDGDMLSSIVCAGPTETCDLGVANSAAPGATCRPGCLLAGCGDGIVDPGEACDDGNGVDTDECTSSCTVAACGDGIRAFDGTEQCDDGNLVAGDGCDALCQREDACATLVISEDTFANNEGMLRFLGDYATESDFVLDPVGVTTSDAALLSRYAVVILNKSSRDFSRSDFDTLNNFAIRGGTLILAGSNLSNFGSDTLAPRLGRVNSAGFGPFGDLGRVEAVDDWALDGRRRFFETGADFVLNDFSHDQITSDPRLGSRTLVSIESAALLTVAPVRSGRVYVWNGNDGFGDWVNSLDSAAALLHIIDATCEQRSTGSR